MLESDEDYIYNLHLMNECKRGEKSSAITFIMKRKGKCKQRKGGPNMRQF